MRIKKRLSIPLLLASAAMVYVLVATPPRLVQEPAPTAPEAPTADAYASGVEMQVFDENGKVAQRTESDALKRFRDSGRTTFDRPRRWSFDADGDWYAVSEEGELFERRDILELRGDVQLRYESDSVMFATDELVINLDKQTARSVVGVRAWQDSDGSEIRADSLYTNLETQVAVLTGNVRSRYVPRD